MSRLIFEGTTKECLLHYADNFLPPKGSRNSSEAKKPMANFTGVGVDTVMCWVSGQNKPLGESLLKLRFFLEAVGYGVVELRSLRGSVNYMLAEMLAYGVLSMEHAVEHLGFNDSHSVFRLARGDANTSSIRAGKIQGMYEGCTSALLGARQKLLKELGLSQNEEVVLVPSVEQQELGGVDDESMVILAHFVMAITPLLEEAVTDTTKDQRNKLRSLVGEKGMFRISRASSRLCSEKAREVLNGQ